MKSWMIHSLILLGLVAVVPFTTQPVDAQGKLASQNVVDCSAAEMKKARMQLRSEIEPFLNTAAEEYSGNPKVLAEKEAGRNKILVRWIKMRCVCNKGMSDFEKTLCLAMKQNLTLGAEDNCLIRY